MIHNDKQYGRPFIQYTGTQAAIEALSGLAEGSTAYATDIDKFGSYNGSAWTWGGGHVIQDEGASLTNRTNLNFVGTGVTATDDSGNDATVVTIPNTAPINVYNETATADGTNTTYYLINVAVAGTIRVYIDGIRQPASDDTSDTDVVIFSSAPAENALLMFDYELSIS